MAIDTLKRLAVFVAMILAQALVFNHIRLFGYAMPVPYVYFVIIIPRGYPRWATLLWSFAMGLVIDIFTNTPGLASASLTLVAAVQPYYLELFVPRDSAENLKPTIQTLGPSKYSTYVIPLTLLYCVVFYSLEFFNFFNWLQWLFCVVGSTVITLVFIYTFEIFKSK